MKNAGDPCGWTLDSLATLLSLLEIRINSSIGFILTYPPWEWIFRMWSRLVRFLIYRPDVLDYAISKRIRARSRTTVPKIPGTLPRPGNSKSEHYARTRGNLQLAYEVRVVRKQQVSLSRSSLGTQVLLRAASALTPFFKFYTGTASLLCPRYSFLFILRNDTNST